LNERTRALNDPGKSVVIENTVDVERFPPHEPNDNGICNALRFSPDQIGTEILHARTLSNTMPADYGALYRRLL
jgi:hypothetical protein